jgi:hypothetical protein
MGQAAVATQQSALGRNTLPNREGGAAGPYMYADVDRAVAAFRGDAAFASGCKALCIPSRIQHIMTYLCEHKKTESSQQATLIINNTVRAL